jgi:hypothetical protein
LNAIVRRSRGEIPGRTKGAIDVAVAVGATLLALALGAATLRQGTS